MSVNYKQNVLFKRNDQNIAYQLTSTQMPAMLGGAFVDLYMTKGHMREPHWHPNAWELDVVVSGEVQVSVLDPDTSKDAQLPNKRRRSCFYTDGLVALD